MPVGPVLPAGFVPPVVPGCVVPLLPDGDPPVVDVEGRDVIGGGKSGKGFDVIPATS